ncbi:hypothetical protein IE53DRAFT_378269 [Violaceomyces palustris]|uniref:Uncharacterized protein n=1 Tax=Violaceomyces palustris TaxID=1673888 RepID=A0ACD0P2K1_9BASI|nr:hypothetical protein IE53DRAFT_378269 [Violaceomyces palustris]
MANSSSSSAIQYQPPPMSYGPRHPAPVRSQLPKRIDVADLTPNNLGQLRKLNTVLFPIPYSERFYKDALSPDVASICKLGLFNDIAVGNVCCRFEPVGESSVKVYIMTLGVLAPYRRLGVASALLSHILKVAEPGSKVSLRAPVDPNAPAPKPKKGKDGKEIKEEPKMIEKVVDSIYLHVQTGNEEAKLFYSKFGFHVAGEVDNYYRRIQPSSAWVLEKKVA